MLKNKCSVWKRIKFPTFWYNCYYFTWSDTHFIQLETLLINHPSYIHNSCVKSTHHTVCWTNNGGNFPSQITCDKLSYYIRKRRRVSRSNSDQATGWTTEESSFDSRQGQMIFLYSHSVQTSSGLSGHLLLRLRNINSPTTVCGFFNLCNSFCN